MKLLIALLVLTVTPWVALAQEEVESPTEPDLSAFLVGSTSTDQCRPVRINFTVVNKSSATITSQRPYSGATYSLYQTFQNQGFRALPDRWMVGVSLDRGKDGYPYRWGFRAPMGAGKMTNIAGYLTFVEPGTYNITAALLRQDEPVAGSVRTATVAVAPCLSPDVPGQPQPIREIRPVAGGRRFPGTVPYMYGGHLLIEVRPFVSYIGGDIYMLDRRIILRKPGVEVVLSPGSRVVIVNGVRMLIPVPVQQIGDIVYVPVRFISPFFGHTFYYYPYNRSLYLDAGIWP